jgi:hypothetical protein
MSEQKQSLGKLVTPDGKESEIIGYYCIYRDDREIKVYKTDDDTFLVQSESHLRENGHEKVTTTFCYTRSTFFMLLETLVMASTYFGHKLSDEVKKLHGSDGVKVEYAGFAEPEVGEYP